MKIAVLKETAPGENRVAIAPDTLKKFQKLGLEVTVEDNAGEPAGFPNSLYQTAGAKIVNRGEALLSEIVAAVNMPDAQTVATLKQGTLLVGLLDPFSNKSTFEQLARQGVCAIAMEWIPRTSRAQAMDVLSSQANIAGYRAVIESAAHYRRFLPMMMTSAGVARPAKLMVLGAGVAGLQAIATAKRLGAQVEAFDIRPEVKEQILSLGAKFVELDLGESGVGTGGYAKQLSESAQALQQKLLGERLAQMDIVISTANIPGKRAPVLITAETVSKMKPGSVIVDMAAANGGNCPLTQMGQIINHHGVTLVGLTNYPSLMAADASQFFGQNLQHLLALLVKNESGSVTLKFDLNDDIIANCLVCHNGAVRRS